jgi:hypothetical protein
MLKLVISGGQTGVDQAAWDAAVHCGILTFGYMPLGYLTEKGSRPEYAQKYHAVALPTAEYPPRTRLNVKKSDATIWIGHALDSRGYRCTQKAAYELNRPFHDFPAKTMWSDAIAELIKAHGWERVNFAGPRESSCLGIHDKVMDILIHAFLQLKEKPTD